MENEFKRQGWILFSGIALIIISICTFIGNRDYMLHGKPDSINKMLYDNNYELSSDEIRKQTRYATLTVNSSLGSFAVEKHRVNGIPMGEDTFYIAFLEDNTVMGVRVGKQNEVDMLEKITSETYASKDYYSDNTITLEGKIVQLTNTELKKYYDDALISLGIKDNDKSQVKIRYIYIDASQNKGNLWFMTIAFFVIGVIALSGDTIFYVIRNRFKTKEQGVDIPDNSSSSIYMDTTSYAIPTPVPDVPDEYTSNNEYYGANTAMDSSDDDKEPRFGTPNRYERTEDNKISISGRNLIK